MGIIRRSPPLPHRFVSRRRQAFLLRYIFRGSLGSLFTILLSFVKKYIIKSHTSSYKSIFRLLAPRQSPISYCHTVIGPLFSVI